MTLRWKPHARKVLGITDLIEDADGARRIVAEGAWLAVVYAKDRNTAYVETIERASVNRAFTVIQGQNGAIYFVSMIEIDSSVGRILWRGDTREKQAQHIVPSGVTSLTGVLPGRLTLPDGTHYSTGTGSGFFEAKGLVRAYAPRRDTDLAGGWSVITEVHRARRASAPARRPPAPLLHLPAPRPSLTL